MVKYNYIFNEFYLIIIYDTNIIFFNLKYIFNYLLNILFYFILFYFILFYFILFYFILFYL